MKPWIVYMIRCEDNSLYTGATNDLVNRWHKHKEGKGAKYTKSHKPVNVVYVEPCKDRSSALKKEYKIKQLSKSEKEKLINHG